MYRRIWDAPSGTAGVTLLEILVAMLILALVASGMFGAFLFARQVSYRSEANLIAQNYAQRIAEQIRASLASGGGPPLNPAGIYLDPDYDEDPTTDGPQDPPPPQQCAGGWPIAPKRLIPDDGKEPKLPEEVRPDVIQAVTVPDAWRNKYNLRWRYYAEDHKTDTDCDGVKRGINFNPGQDDEVDLTWVDIKVDWNPPRS